MEQKDKIILLLKKNRIKVIFIINIKQFHIITLILGVIIINKFHKLKKYLWMVPLSIQLIVIFQVMWDYKKHIMTHIYLRK